MKNVLLYVMGASGSGKDSLMRHARQRLAGDTGAAFAHRYITRPVEAGGENHVALSEAEFESRQSVGLFALHWEGNGHRYGIGIEINQWLAKGVTVVVNGSRAYLPEAKKRYGELLPVWIETSPESLRQRLLLRGRETPEEIERRLARHQALEARREPGGEVIRNDGALEAGGEALVALIARYRRRP